MDISHLIDDLNDKQREAVSAGLTNILVLAGAGSGKTRVLVHRIAWLIEVEKLSPFNILAVTFTNKAAHEMKTRIASMIGMRANTMWVGTFHGLAHRILRAHWEPAGLAKNFQIIDSNDQFRLIRRIIREKQLDEAKWPPRQAQSYINQKKDHGLRPDDIKGTHDHFESVMQNIYEQYEAICQKSGLVDFAEMLLRAYDVLRKHEDIKQHYQKRFRYILVDEFQDTNTLQYNWLRLLATPQNNTMIVGDDDQSIYSWRGARVDNIHRFEKDYPEVKTIRLEQNYRSTGHILSAANQLIANNSNRLGKNLWTASGDGERISLYAAFNDTDEARFIISRIKKWRDDNGSLSECAILYRSNAQSRLLEEVLIQAALPYRIYGGLRFFERAEIKDCLAYLNLICHYHNDAAFERIVNHPPRGIGARTIEYVRELAKERDQSLWTATQNVVAEKRLPSRATGALNAFIGLIEEAALTIKELDLAESIEHMIHHAGLRAHFQKDRTERGCSRVENLDELISAAQQFNPDDLDENIPLLSAFLTHAALEAGETQAAKHQDCVQLMTLHSAKGLEFPLVFLSGMEEGLLPHQMSMEDPNGLAEERRLCYVGMTRAMKKLYFTYAESRFLYGQEKMQCLSRFLGELPQTCLEDVRARTKVSTPVSSRRRYTTEQSVTSSNGVSLQIGQQVRHRKFGNGVIINIEGSGAKARLHINFGRSVGSKWLMMEYANLETA
jgi:DNA helicase II / ATP-dependent DNA helicase PcrA